MKLPIVWNGARRGSRRGSVMNSDRNGEPRQYRSGDGSAVVPPSTGGRTLAVIFLLSIGIILGFFMALLLALSPQSPGLVGVVMLQVLGLGSGLIGVIRAKTRRALIASLLLAIGMIALAVGLCFVIVG